MLNDIFTIFVEHLVRANNSHNNYWKNSVANETFDVDEEQFLIVKVGGDYRKSRKFLAVV